MCAFGAHRVRSCAEKSASAHWRAVWRWLSATSPTRIVAHDADTAKSQPGDEVRKSISLATIARRVENETKQTVFQGQRRELAKTSNYLWHSFG